MKTVIMLIAAFSRCGILFYFSLFVWAFFHIKIDNGEIYIGYNDLYRSHGRYSLNRITLYEMWTSDAKKGWILKYYTEGVTITAAFHNKETCECVGKNLAPLIVKGETKYTSCVYSTGIYQGFVSIKMDGEIDCMKLEKTDLTISQKEEIHMYGKLIKDLPDEQRKAIEGREYKKTIDARSVEWEK
jgi:hypothetical protein